MRSLLPPPHLYPRSCLATACDVLQEGNEASVFDDEELAVQVVELLGSRCSVTFPCSSILRFLCLHVKVSEEDSIKTTQKSLHDTGLAEESVRR